MAYPARCLAGDGVGFDGGGREDEDVLSVSGLRKSYGPVTALDGLDLEVTPGEIVGLLGPNGAGKTTLVSIVAGLRRADAGSVRVNGVDALARPHDARRYIGLAPQDLGMYPVVSVRRNLILFGRLHGLAGRQLAQRIEAVAAAMGLIELLDREAGTLSGGQKRRLHTALALLHHPPLLLLDEATTGADVRTRADILTLVQQLAGEGAAVLYSTHYMHEVETLGASVVIIEHGRCIARGTVADLVASHGISAVELAFAGPPPQLASGWVKIEGDRLRLATQEPAIEMAQAFAALGAESSRLLSVDVIRPSLESVYLALTGRRYQDAEDAEEALGAS